MVEEEIIHFLKLYKAHLVNKIYCHVEEVPERYHYEKRHRGYDHLGSLGWDTVKVVDTYKKEVVKKKINRYNVIDVVENVINGNGWIESEG